MKKFEYKGTILPDTLDEFILLLNSLGDKGWELVHVGPSYTNHDSAPELSYTAQVVSVVLKREILV